MLWHFGRKPALADALDSDPTEEERVTLEREFLRDPDKGGDVRIAGQREGKDSGVYG